MSHTKENRFEETARRVVDALGGPEKVDMRRRARRRACLSPSSRAGSTRWSSATTCR
ncbi:hypothetical protein V5S96_07400 [Corynebacterium mastitidis]|uniref:Uncharacterized protein n=1 Tax=Corynebacterium mastitidis TaxID=161890 RepID=A0ABU8NYT9_9CORY